MGSAVAARDQRRAPPRRAPKALEAEWRDRLRRSGFQDLEGADPSGPLSDRGSIHAVNNSPQAREAMAHRMASGADYVAWADDVLHSHQFNSTLERAVWERLVTGDALLTTARALGITYHAARDAVLAVKAAVKARRANQPTLPANIARRQLRRLIKRARGRELEQLAVVVLNAVVAA